MKKRNDFSGAVEYYDLILGKKKFEQSAQFVVKELKKFKVKTVLELGCGTGLYLFPLKKAGFKIEGLDISKEMLAKARKADGKIRLYKQDMSKFKINKQYDAILCLNSSLVLLPNFESIVKTIKNCYDHLKDDGILMLDLPNHAIEIKESSSSEEHKTYKLKDRTVKVIFKDYEKGNKWVSEWKGFVRQGTDLSKFTEYYEELIYPPMQLENALKKEGFKVLKRFGSRKGGKFNKNESYRRFYICQKY